MKRLFIMLMLAGICLAEVQLTNSVGFAEVCPCFWNDSLLVYVSIEPDFPSAGNLILRNLNSNSIDTVVRDLPISNVSASENEIACLLGASSAGAEIMVYDVNTSRSYMFNMVSRDMAVASPFIDDGKVTFIAGDDISSNLFVFEGDSVRQLTYDSVVRIRVIKSGKWMVSQELHGRCFHAVLRNIDDPERFLIIPESRNCYNFDIKNDLISIICDGRIVLYEISTERIIDLRGMILEEHEISFVNIGYQDGRYYLVLSAGGDLYLSDERYRFNRLEIPGDQTYPVFSGDKFVWVDYRSGLIPDIYGSWEEDSRVSEVEVQPRNVSISAYPNPFNSTCHFDTNENIEVVDINGKLIETISDGVWHPDARISSGIYFACCGGGEQIKLVYTK